MKDDCIYNNVLQIRHIATLRQSQDGAMIVIGSLSNHGHYRKWSPNLNEIRKYKVEIQTFSNINLSYVLPLQFYCLLSRNITTISD